MWMLILVVLVYTRLQCVVDPKVCNSSVQCRFTVSGQFSSKEDVFPSGFPIGADWSSLSLTPHSHKERVRNGHTHLLTVLARMGYIRSLLTVFLLLLLFYGCMTCKRDREISSLTVHPGNKNSQSAVLIVTIKKCWSYLLLWSMLMLSEENRKHGESPRWLEGCPDVPNTVKCRT